MSQLSWWCLEISSLRLHFVIESAARTVIAGNKHLTLCWSYLPEKQRPVSQKTERLSLRLL